MQVLGVGQPGGMETCWLLSHYEASWNGGNANVAIGWKGPLGNVAPFVSLFT